MSLNPTGGVELEGRLASIDADEQRRVLNPLHHGIFVRAFQSQCLVELERLGQGRIFSISIACLHE